MVIGVSCATCYMTNYMKTVPVPSLNGLEKTEMDNLANYKQNDFQHIKKNGYISEGDLENGNMRLQRAVQTEMRKSQTRGSTGDMGGHLQRLLDKLQSSDSPCILGVWENSEGVHLTLCPKI
uniref:Uncharacterized protein LOC102802666 n=1 Tax=Saccoglossus kowalevskii TaxID=10224 RepID=A0ABM0MFA0_SACKO|nr:PREDICTED: uncharacterized protein LOC102802666 [Saccoglossus kowalevskii]